jgi:hypothetical protein
LLQVGRIGRKKPGVENPFEVVDQVDMTMQVLGKSTDAKQPLVGGSEGLLEVTGVPIRVEIHLDHPE